MRHVISSGLALCVIGLLSATPAHAQSIFDWTDHEADQVFWTASAIHLGLSWYDAFGQTRPCLRAQRCTEMIPTTSFIVERAGTDPAMWIKAGFNTAQVAGAAWARHRWPKLRRLTAQGMVVTAGVDGVVVTLNERTLHRIGLR